MTDTTALKPEPIKHRLKARIQVAGQLNNRWQAYLTEAQTIENALDGPFWTDAAETIKGHDGKQGRMDIIEVRKADTGQYWELIVDEVGKGYLKVHLLFRDPIVIPQVSEGSPLVTKWNVGKNGHEVIRVADRQLMAGPFPTKQKAMDWIADFMKTTAVAA